MKILVDTNVFLRFANINDQRYEIVKFNLNKLITAKAILGYTPQVVREFWAVARRPANVNGLNLSAIEAQELLQGVSHTMEFWDDVPGIAQRWQELVVALDVKGVQVHDANLAAAALTHGATHVLTFNSKDFARYERFGLIALSPNLV